MSQSSKIALRAKVLKTYPVDQGSGRLDLTLETALTLTDGTGAGQADLVYSDTRTLAASSSETHNLSAMTDPFSQSAAFVKIKLIMIKASESNTNNVEIGAAGTAYTFYSNLFKDATDIIVLRPGAMFCFYDPTGLAVTGSPSVDDLKIANSSSGSSVDYDIMIVGTSA